MKRIECNRAVSKQETSPHLGMQENKLALLQNENGYMKLDVPCPQDMKTLLRDQIPGPRQLVQQTKVVKAPLLPPLPSPAGNTTFLVLHEKKEVLAVQGRELRTENPQAFSQAPLMLLMVYRFWLGPGKLGFKLKWASLVSFISCKQSMFH